MPNYSRQDGSTLPDRAAEKRTDVAMSNSINNDAALVMMPQIGVLKRKKIPLALTAGGTFG
jgi:hypothetical protein